VVCIQIQVLSVGMIIVYFQVLVLVSLRVPKRMTIRGDDKREYRFLVKCGEDLRMDQRIEQVFSNMNKIMRQDMSCQHHALTTYAVIPMNARYVCMVIPPTHMSHYIYSDTYEHTVCVYGYLTHMSHYIYRDTYEHTACWIDMS